MEKKIGIQFQTNECGDCEALIIIVTSYTSHKLLRAVEHNTWILKRVTPRSYCGGR